MATGTKSRLLVDRYGVVLLLHSASEVRLRNELAFSNLMSSKYSEAKTLRFPIEHFVIFPNT